MKDEGEQMYGMWSDEMATQNVEVDPWEDLSPEDQRAWGRLMITLVEQGWNGG
jgi:hypothetical protein